MRPLFALALAATAVPFASAADVPTHKNAAMQYRLAFELLPSYSQMSPEDKKLFDEWDTVPLTKDRVETIDRWSSSLRYLHRGAALKECVWPATVNSSLPGSGRCVRCSFSPLSSGLFVR